MKKEYSGVKASKIEFNSKDVIATSGGCTPTWNNQGTDGCETGWTKVYVLPHA